MKFVQKTRAFKVDEIDNWIRSESFVISTFLYIVKTWATKINQYFLYIFVK